jgi:hypothetical protein
MHPAIGVFSQVRFARGKLTRRGEGRQTLVD